MVVVALGLVLNAKTAMRLKAVRKNKSAKVLKSSLNKNNKLQISKRHECCILYSCVELDKFVANVELLIDAECLRQKLTTV